MELCVLEGYEAFYYIHKDGNLKGAVITRVDYFDIAGTDNFVQKVIDQVAHELTVSMI